MSHEQPKQDGPKEPPLHARLFWYRLEPLELLALKGMVEHCWDGSTIWMSIPRLSAYTKISEKQLQRMIHGYDERRKDAATGKQVFVKHHPGFLARGILTQLAKEKPAKRRPATYRLNEAALSIDPKMHGYIAEEWQGILPGVDLRPVPGEPVRPRQKNLPALGAPAATQKKLLIPGDTVSPVARSSFPTQCRQSPDTVSPDSLQESQSVKSLKDLNGFYAFECNQKRKVPTTTATFPDELAQGLREFVSDMDSAAIQRIWDECRKNAPDCGAGEILYFAGTKAYYLPKADNPTGFLISALPLCVTQDEVVKLRGRLAWGQRRDEERRRQAEQNAREMEEWRAGAPERECQRAEAERIEAERQAAELRERAEREQQKQDLIRRAVETLDQMPDSELQALRAEAMKDPQVAAHCSSIQKLVALGIATDSHAEPRIREAMVDLLVQQMEGTP